MAPKQFLLVLPKCICACIALHLDWRFLVELYNYILYYIIFCICRISTKGKHCHIPFGTHLWSCVMKWCLLKKGKGEVLCEAFRLFFSWRMMTWILNEDSSCTYTPTHLRPLHSLLVSFAVHWPILHLTFLYLSLSLFSYLSFSFLFSCLCWCSCLYRCLCWCLCLCLVLVVVLFLILSLSLSLSLSFCCLCLIVPLLFLPAHQPVGGHEAALEQKI